MVGQLLKAIETVKNPLAYKSSLRTIVSLSGAKTGAGYFE